MSLCLALLMSICFDAFLKSQHESKRMDLTYYYAGLGCFVVGLGLFTNALVGGAVIWLFMLVQMVKQSSSKGIRASLHIVVPFVGIVVGYLCLRGVLNNTFFVYQDALFQTYSTMQPTDFERNISILKSLTPQFFAALSRQALPYFSRHYLGVYLLLILLLAKEVMIRRKQSFVISMWVCFALATLVIPIIGRIPLMTRIYGSAYFALSPWYFCYPIAGLSIALALALRLPASIETMFRGLHVWTRVVSLAAMLVVLALLNSGNIKRIRFEAIQTSRENLLFAHVVKRYTEAMSAFLESPAYSLSDEYYMKDLPVVDADVYPSGWSVTQENVFSLYFPDAENVKFVRNEGETPNLYLWTRGSVVRIR
jgi:hypothetical protein